MKSIKFFIALLRWFLFSTISLFLLACAGTKNSNLETGVNSPIVWEHLSTVNNDLELPFPGNQQTSSLVIDVDRNGLNEFFITERTSAPSVVMYKLENNEWERYIIDNDPLRIEAGATSWDITGNGYMDIVFGGDSRSNQVWWWENPSPNLDKTTPWKGA